MTAVRKLAAILAADVVGYSRLAGVDEDRTLARLRALRSDLIDPTIAVHHGRIVKRTGDGAIAEFRSVVDAVRCAVEIQNGMVERNAGVAPEKRIEFRIGVHLGDVVEEADGDLMGDGVNIAARLESLAEPGGLCLSGAAYEQVRDRLKETFVDLGEQKLKNIARPVRVHAVKSRPAGKAQSSAEPAAEKSGPPRLSIVVLPFANMGGDPEQEYFVDGVTESLTTDLSRISGSFVIGRHTAFTFKGKAVDLKQIGRDLNVRYVLEGSVQRAGARLRVNVQLIDAESGAHLWADRFDKPAADLFDTQDEIVARLANALNTQLVTAEARRAEGTAIPDSMDLYFQGMARFHIGPAPEDAPQARSFFERAISLDPRNVEAMVALGGLELINAITFLIDDRAQRLTSAEAVLARALSLAPDHALAHALMGRVEIYTNRAVQGLANCEIALALDRNLTDAHAIIAAGKIIVGRPDETENHVEEALRLSPRDRHAFGWMQVVGAAKIHLGKDEEAIGWLRRSIEANRNFGLSQFYLAAALGLRGRLDEGRLAAETGLSLNPTFTISRFRAGVGSDNPTYLAQRERVYDGMRKAGLPER